MYVPDDTYSLVGEFLLADSSTGQHDSLDQFIQCGVHVDILISQSNTITLIFDLLNKPGGAI